MECSAEPVEERLIVSQTESGLFKTIYVSKETKASLRPKDCLQMRVNVEV